jgi:hypothetical protein
MLAYFGRMISTACPRSSSSPLRPDTTSPSPPAFATGAHSAATITTYTAHPPRAARRVPPLPVPFHARTGPPGGIARIG